MNPRDFNKILFIDPIIKVYFYLLCLFLMPFLGEWYVFPKSYFAKKNNVFNLYFVKIGWFWTLCLSVPFVIMTSYVYCCGKYLKIVQHLIRLAVATFAWFIWTNLFMFIDNITGECAPSPTSTGSLEFPDRNLPRRACLKNKLYWQGFDISGHSFLLIYSCLILIEESSALIGWKNIGDLIINKEYGRRFQSISTYNSYAPGLTHQEFSKLKNSYEKFTPFIKLIFIAMMFLVLLWDAMLINTLIYFHTLLEKFIGGGIAICTWYFTYHYMYLIPWIPPCLPGEGVIMYRSVQKSTLEESDNYSDSSSS